MPIVHATTRPIIDPNNTSVTEEYFDCDNRESAIHWQNSLSPNSHPKAEPAGQEASTLQKAKDQELEQQQVRSQLRQAHRSDSPPLEHRPDSPTSLEDSQSESGVDSFFVETTETERPMPRFSNDDVAAAVDSNLAMIQHNMTIQTEVANSLAPMSPSQIVTPPLSPVKSEQADGELEKMDNDAFRPNMRAGSVTALPTQVSGARNEDEAHDGAVDTISQENGEACMDSESVVTSTQEESATSTPELGATPVPQPIIPSSAPKLSAWSSLLPGVSPIAAPKLPIPKTVVRPPPVRKSEDLRMHERFPIVLPPESEAKLSMDMVDLFESLLPTEESHSRRTRLIKKIESILHLEWPGQDISVHPFGSTVNDLGTSSSDVDICIMTTWPGLKNVQMLANAFRKHGMQKVFCVPRAKVPIVKLWDPELYLSCDININTSLGLQNTKMIKTYVAIDPRVRPFAMIIKHWARRRVLNDAANGGTISTYTWICIVINFLQMRSPPILPKLHKIPHTLSEDNQVINGNNTSFCQDLELLEGFGLPNKETLGGLLYAFFRRFAIEFDYDNHVISVREGCYLTKESKGWNLPGKQYKLLCVEEPFDTSRNLGNSSDMTSSKGLKEEFKRALEILYQKVSLNECCAQFVFPPSYYHSSNNIRKGSNGAITHHSYAPGRRYTNGYRTTNNYYDEDYGDDDEDDSPAEISVMETLNIGTRSSMSKDPTGGSKHHSDNREPVSASSRGHANLHGGLSKSSSSKDGSSSHPGRGRNNDHSNQNQSRNRSKQYKGEKDGAGDSSRHGPSRSGKLEKSSSSGGSSVASSQRSKKSSGGNNGDRQKNGRSSNGPSGNGGRAPRAAVEFSLADIASVAPKLMSTVSRADQELLGHGEDITARTGTGAEESSSGGRNRKKGGRRNVVWSTNSNRGESSRRQPGGKGALPEEQEKAKVIFVAGEEDGSGMGTPPLA